MRVAALAADTRCTDPSRPQPLRTDSNRFWSNRGARLTRDQSAAITPSRSRSAVCHELPLFLFNIYFFAVKSLYFHCTTSNRCYPVLNNAFLTSIIAIRVSVSAGSWLIKYVGQVKRCYDQNTDFAALCCGVHRAHIIVTNGCWSELQASYGGCARPGVSRWIWSFYLLQPNEAGL